jgi:hypothetical protein
MTILRKGQTWEHYRSTIVGDGSLVGTYVLEDFEDPSKVKSPIAYLRNTESEGMARIFQRWLHEGESKKPHAYWRLAE